MNKIVLYNTGSQRVFMSVHVHYLLDDIKQEKWPY